MRKTILATVIAATAIAPVMASAQEWQGRRGNRDGDNGSQAGQAARAERQADRPDRGAYRARREAQPAARPQQVPVDREAFRAQREAQRAAQPQAPGRQGPRQWNGDRQQFRQERREDRRDLRGGTVTQQHYRNDRQDDRRDFRNDRRDDRRDRDWNNNRGWNNDNGGNWNRGDGNRWNRQWRNDQRYNWQGWRGQNRNAYRLPRYYAPRGYSYGYQRFGIGITLGSILFSQNYWINDPWQYRLPPAYGPYRWVRYYNDALLVDIDSGEVVDVINDIFW